MPDFIVRLKTSPPVHLIVETKGFNEREEVKRAAAERWVAAVNADGTFGTWKYALAKKRPIDDYGATAPRGLMAKQWRHTVAGKPAVRFGFWLSAKMSIEAATVNASRVAASPICRRARPVSLRPPRRRSQY
jgi:hypothetical protein